MTGISFSEWQAIYLLAVSEPLDSTDLPELVRQAEMAVSQRLEELEEDPRADKERKALALALRSLSYVGRERVGKRADPGAAQLGTE